MFNYGEVTEEEKKYEYVKLTQSEKPISALLIELRNGGIITFPYSYYAPTELENKGKGNYEINLIGGGLGVILYFKNFDEEKRNFLEKMRASCVDTLYECANKEIGENQPMLDKVEIQDMKKRRA